MVVLIFTPMELELFVKLNEGMNGSNISEFKPNKLQVFVETAEDEEDTSNQIMSSEEENRCFGMA